MKKVIHLGPAESRGGISAVIKNMRFNPPEGYHIEVINTHKDGSILQKMILWAKARKYLKQKIKHNEIDIAHIHVTHSLSWWRKVDLKRICNKNSIPVIIQIHSGRFQDFCGNFFGLMGFLVKRTLSSDCKVIILEERWKTILREWIPENTEIIPNTSERRIRRENKINKDIQLLMLARKSKGKGHIFAIKVLQSLKIKGFSAKLTLTGIDRMDIKKYNNKSIFAKGWISEDEKLKLMETADFLIMPSEFEGSSMSVIEAIVNNLPPIVSPASSQTLGIKELVIPLNDVENWSKRIIALSKQEEYDRIIKLLETKKERYSIENSVKNIKRLYDSLLIK